MCALVLCWKSFMGGTPLNRLYQFNSVVLFWCVVLRDLQVFLFPCSGKGSKKTWIIPISTLLLYKMDQTNHFCTVPKGKAQKNKRLVQMDYPKQRIIICYHYEINLQVKADIELIMCFIALTSNTHKFSSITGLNADLSALTKTLQLCIRRSESTLPFTLMGKLYKVMNWSFKI